MVNKTLECNISWLWSWCQGINSYLSVHSQVKMKLEDDAESLFIYAKTKNKNEKVTEMHMIGDWNVLI